MTPRLAHHVTGQAEVSGISAIAEPEMQFTEMVGVEEGGQEEGAIDYNLADDPIISDADLEVIRVNRAGVRVQVMDPIQPTPDKEPHSTLYPFLEPMRKYAIPSA